MKKKVLACVLSGILAVSIFGCGSKSMMATESAVADSAAYDDMAYDSGYDTTEAASAEEAGSGAVTSENGIEEVQETDRKLIRNVNLSLQTKEFDTVLDNMSQKIKDLGGYIQDSSVWGSSSDYSSSRSASYTLRIPSDKLDEFIDVVETLGNVTYKNESVDDVTLRYVDVDSHKKHWRQNRRGCWHCWRRQKMWKISLPLKTVCQMSAMNWKITKARSGY